ncbi:vitamin B12 dependent-methionine synthase activation domain-containing protein [uncultured Anaerovibrio sp.]|uniref:vitamin B12 dependent-methionine synthase activation domain-containing protein n=1 Tax=uncultured Anaerovibrio sp. TaxID=361586 RepID=UPI00261E3EFB|nr:vitamin B12 dependent-methionine synthase activation domain-containing protein [uncultured Anaerovibrio sp.]
MAIFNAPYYKIDKEETKRYAGLQQTTFNEEIIEEACDLARLLIHPTGNWEIYDYDDHSQTIYSDPPFYLEGSSIKNHLLGCTKVVILTATVGQEIEEKITALFKEGKYTLSLLLDAAATTAVEENANLMEKAISERVNREGYIMKWRFSPGYGDWPIEQQPEMIRTAKADTIGIHLTESMMLEPRKSITAIIGLYLIEESCPRDTKTHDCSNCTKTDCLARK